METRRWMAIFTIIAFFVVGINAQNYIAINKTGKVYDDASAKYVTLNQNNGEVVIQPGMVFKTFEKKPGMIMIEYSPGLRGFIDEKITTTDINLPVAGISDISNNKSSKAEIANDTNGGWSLKANGKSYKGKVEANNILVFFDETNNPAYSVVNFGNGNVVVSYDNSLTNFF